VIATADILSTTDDAAIQGSSRSFERGTDEKKRPDAFQHRLRGPRHEGHRMRLPEFSSSARSEEAKWSSDHERLSDEADRRKGAISGLHCSALRVRKPARDSLGNEAIALRRFSESSYLENCIEKNFHVPNMRAGPCAEHGLQFQNCVPLNAS